MDTHVIKECLDLSLAGKINFGEVVSKLTQVGTERYLADLIGKRKFYFGLNDEVHSEQLIFDGPKIPKNWDVTSIKSAISDAQQGKIFYPVFLRRIMEAGCCHYEVFITGKKAIYCGRDGNQHIESFPQT